LSGDDRPNRSQWKVIRNSVSDDNLGKPMFRRAGETPRVVQVARGISNAGQFVAFLIG
jgi:hypothetical protein